MLKFDDAKYVDYPNITDENFVEILLRKKEFYKTRATRGHEEDLCSTTQFKLLPHQKFQQQFMTVDTPYNSILLYHSLGSGKTCSAISICENFKDFLDQHDTKAYILSNDIVRAGFINELLGFDSSSGYSKPRCGGNAYLSELERLSMIEDPEISNSLIKVAKKQIDHYYEFMGYGQFANLALKIKIKDKNTGLIRQSYTNIRKASKALIKIRKGDISNSIVVVDEVHNILPKGQYNNSNSSYRAYKALIKLLNSSSNVRLVLMSGTPIFDKPSEILEILKLLLLNDKRFNLEELKEIDELKLFKGDQTKLDKTGKEFLKKYVPGYVSYIKGHNPNTFPLKIDKGQHIGKFLERIKVIRCYMSNFQLKTYAKALLEDYNSKGWGFKEKSGYASVIVYQDDMFGKEGYNWMKKKLPERRNSILKGEAALEKHACKLAALFKNVKKSKGPVFISSEYVNKNGIDVLEQLFLANGYEKWNYNKSTSGKSFASIVGTTKNKEDIRSAFADPDNADGSQIMILLGSPTVSEGMNLKNVRQVHIMEPHENMSHIEQTIGRAIRHCSHVLLPKDERNVEIYKYVGSIKTTSRPILKKILESTDIPKEFYKISRDEWIYKIAETKLIKNDQIKRILKEYAVDCPLFKSKNFTGEDSKLQCKLLPNLPNYQESELDVSTYNILKDTHEIYSMKLRIKNLFAANNVWTAKAIIEFIQKKEKWQYQDDLKHYVYLALDELLRTKEPLRNKFNRSGYLIYRGRYYIFNLDDELNKTPFVQRNALMPILILERDIDGFINAHPERFAIKKEKTKPTKPTKPKINMSMVQQESIPEIRAKLEKQGIAKSDQYLGCIKKNSGKFAIITPAVKGKGGKKHEKIGSVCHESAKIFTLKTLIELALKLGIGEKENLDADVKFEYKLNKNKTNFEKGIKITSKKIYICSKIQEKMEKSGLMIGTCPTKSVEI